MHLNCAVLYTCKRRKKGGDEQGGETPGQVLLRDLFWKPAQTACLPGQIRAFIAHHTKSASVLLRPSHSPVAQTPKHSACTSLKYLHSALTSARLCKHWEHLVITNFTRNYRSNSAFPWEQIRHDSYIQDIWGSIIAQDCSSLRVGLEMSGQQIQFLRRILKAAPASGHLLSWQPLSWHACQPPSSREILLAQAGSQRARPLPPHPLPGMQRKANILRMPRTTAYSQILL